MPIRYRESGNITIIDIEGNVDINSSEIIETVGYLLSTGKRDFIISLENVNMVDYSGLSVLAIAYKSVINHKGRVRFMHVPPQVTELFKIVKLENVFESYPDEQSALNSLYTQEVSGTPLRRKFKRLDLNLKVKYWLVGQQRRPKVFEGEVQNISPAGLYIFSKYTFPINSQLDIELNIPGEVKLTDAAVRVIWMADKELQPHYFPGMGVSFINLSPDKEKMIIDFIDKNIVHRADD